MSERETRVHAGRWHAGHSLRASAHTGKTGSGSDSGAGCNVNKWVFSHAAGPANSRAGLELDKPGAGPGGRLFSFNVTALCLNLSVPDDCFRYLSLYETYTAFLCTNIFLVQRLKSNRPPAAVMPVSVKNSTTGAGSDSGKKPVCVQAPLWMRSEGNAPKN